MGKVPDMATMTIRVVPFGLKFRTKTQKLHPSSSCSRANAIGAVRYFFEQSLFTKLLSISKLVSSGAANKIEIAAADNYLSLRDQ
jgi:hypothetical protein